MVYMTIYWTSDDCHGQAILTLHLSVGQVILFPYFDHCDVIKLSNMALCQTFFCTFHAIKYLLELGRYHNFLDT